MCLLLAVLLAVAAIVVGPSGNARALTDSVGPINVTISPNDGLTDGQSISIHGATTSGTMSEIRAHICASDINPVNQFNFGFGGAFCSEVAVGTGDFETFETLGNTTSGDLTFKAGIGTATWDDEYLGDSHTLTCDSSHGCDLVVQFQSSVLPGLYYYVAPLTYAGAGGTTTTTTADGGTTSTTTTTADGGTTSTTTTAEGDTTTTTSGDTTTTTSGDTTTTTANPNTDGTVTPASVAPGDTVTVSSPGWAASGTVVATLHSDPVALGTVTADDTGKVTGTFTVPTAAAVGAHQIVLVGTDAAGAARTVTLALTVATVSSTSTTAAVTVAGTNTSTGTGSSSLPFTGAYDVNLAAGALLMLGVALLLLSFRPRRSARL